MKMVRAGFLLAGLLTFAATTTAEAAVVITFENTGLSSGTIEYGGTLGVDPLVGTDITFDIVTVEDGTSTVFDCTGCSLDFTSGPSDLETAGFVSFEGGGSFVITGTITDPNNFDALVASGVLLSGSFSGLVPASALVGQSGQVTINGSGFDEKSEALLRYLGLAPGAFVFANTEISSLNCDTDLRNGFDCTVREADVTNEQVPVPEPGSLALFGMALIGAGAAARRRFARK